MRVGVALLVSASRSFRPTLSLLAGLELVALPGLLPVLAGLLPALAGLGCRPPTRETLVCSGWSRVLCCCEMLICRAIEISTAVLTALSESSSSRDGFVTCVRTDDAEEGVRFRVLLALEEGVEAGGDIICQEGSGSFGLSRSSSWIITSPCSISVGESRIRAD